MQLVLDQLGSVLILCLVNTRTPAIETVMSDPTGDGYKLISATFERIPVAARLGEPEEIAYAVAMLCEEKASWINGQHIHVSGGLCLG
jgi:NAD(P)-dependent dehydrogenase (short-subunit alcohol dehydrogenase family)